jgi:hypothetical protein
MLLSLSEQRSASQCRATLRSASPTLRSAGGARPARIGVATVRCGSVRYGNGIELASRASPAPRFAKRRRLSVAARFCHGPRSAWTCAERKCGACKRRRKSPPEGWAEAEKAKIEREWDEERDLKSARCRPNPQSARYHDIQRGTGRRARAKRR